MFQVYILKSLKDNRTYVGHTSNLDERIQEHNLGKVKATCNRRPFVVLFAEDLPSLDIAKKREGYWKSGAGRRRLREYFREGFPPSRAGRGSPK